MRRYLILLISAAVAIGCMRLGVWQVSRLRERQARNETVRAAGQAPPLRLDHGPGTPAPWRRAGASGVFDFSRQVLVVARSFGGRPAVVVVTPLVMPEAGYAILVERGWAPSPDGRTVDLPRVSEPGDPVTVDGILVGPQQSHPLPADTTWPLEVRWADPVALAPRYPYPLYPLLLRRALPPDSAARAVLRPVPGPELTQGSHLVYAVQWFAFGIIAAVGGVILFRKERREEGRGKGEE